MQSTNRRHFLASSAAAVALSANSRWSLGQDTAPNKAYKISLAQWSLHKPLFAKEIDNLDFAKVAKERFGIDGVEYVNQFFKDKADFFVPVRQGMFAVFFPGDAHQPMVGTGRIRKVVLKVALA